LVQILSPHRADYDLAYTPTHEDVSICRTQLRHLYTTRWPRLQAQAAWLDFCLCLHYREGVKWLG
jgi:hypothetical protein